MASGEGAVTDLSLLRLLLAFCSGVLIGTVNYGGLWITLKRLPSSRHPARLCMTSFVARMAGTPVLLALATGLRPLPIAACLAGFFFMRQIFVRRLAPVAVHEGCQKRGGSVCR